MPRNSIDCPNSRDQLSLTSAGARSTEDDKKSIFYAVDISVGLRTHRNTLSNRLNKTPNSVDASDTEWYKTHSARVPFSRQLKPQIENASALIHDACDSCVSIGVDVAFAAFFRHNYVQRMPRTEDNAKGRLLRIMVSEQINDALNQIADSGLIGHNRIDVAYRFIQNGVLEALDNPHFQRKQKQTSSQKKR
jgi:hypothetical protein